MTEKSTPANELLDDAVRAAAGEATRAAPGADSQRRAPSAPTPALSIAEVLQQQAGHGSSSSGSRPTDTNHGAVRRPVDSSLKAAVSEVGAGETALPRATPPATRAVSAEALADALSGLGAAMPAQSTFQSGQQRRRKFIVGLVFLLLAALAGYSWWWWQADALHAGPAAPAATATPGTPTKVLHDLAAALEQHHAAHHGQWPHSLKSLQGFPPDAIEWQAAHWNARDASGRREIIWLPQGKHYRIVLRQGSETWTISDSERVPKLLKKTSP